MMIEWASSAVENLREIYSEASVLFLIIASESISA